MKSKLKDFIKLYIENTGDTGKILKLILNDKNDYYSNSQDIQLMDISYEYDFKLNKIIDELRFSYFGTKINFLEKLVKEGLIYDVSLINKKYNEFKKALKDNLVTFSFILKNNKLKKIKLYFDIDINLIEKDNLILNSIKNKLDEKIVLISFTIDNSKIIEEKYYYELNNYVYLYSSLFLKNNKKFNLYKKNIPFEVLFRENGLGKILSIKYYYKNFPKNRELFKNKFNINKHNYLNLKEEIGVDFDLKGGINKIDYYIGLYK